MAIRLRRRSVHRRLCHSILLHSSSFGCSHLILILARNGFLVCSGGILSTRSRLGRARDGLLRNCIGHPSLSTARAYHLLGIQGLRRTELRSLWVEASGLHQLLGLKRRTVHLELECQSGRRADGLELQQRLRVKLIESFESCQSRFREVVRQHEICATLAFFKIGHEGCHVIASLIVGHVLCHICHLAHVKPIQRIEFFCLRVQSDFLCCLLLSRPSKDNNFLPWKAIHLQQACTMT
mmetsp:Transcript_133794/g.317070  ORF Transcript_133794/g.317070 Transcript_133794/m.317070 type:complete len:238 (-) Transcript_133794:513-1226(-)